MLALVLHLFLTQIFNALLASSVFPQEWKIAGVSPIYKAGDKPDRGNYRPISVLSTVARLFEKIIYLQLNKIAASESRFDVLYFCQN